MTRIALVEDNADNRLLARAILQEFYVIDEYENGPAALAGLRVNAVSLVLLDISLPEMAGTDVLSALREDVALRGLPVIALTAHAMTGDRERYLELGFDGYVAKPIIDEQVLLGEIERLLRRADGAHA